MWVFALALVSCGTGTKEENYFIRENIDFAVGQIGREIEAIEASDKFLNPVTLKQDGNVYYCNFADWRSGFFPGSVWYLYELTGDEFYRPLAHIYSKAVEEAKNLTWHHDVGFMIYCSFGNGLRLTGEPEYKEIIIQGAKSLSTRFRPVAGVLQSWDVIRGWQSERGWECPVIIDNMMNLELLFEAAKLSGNPSFREIAVSHADRTLKEQFRPDGSSYHVIDYSMGDGSVRNRHTAQGYAHESAWSRGQAWAIYGFTVCYRETGDRKYIDMALKAFDFMRFHRNMPEDLIPYWDMDAPNIPNEYRDASSAAVMASALYEISTMDVDNPQQYKEYADRIMQSLSSPAYRAEPGTNGHFLLMHSVGSIPHNSEIDVPLNYADYYFLEALKRKRDVEN
ncbi:MAG: glycoside hydrolase family 88 protein [Tannerellaceae bacterium]|nr:glycoside hydrolase family 88 protein [Tannerellaceae bacterium]